MSPPVIGIDYTAAYKQGGGIGRYVRELISALAQVDSQTSYRLYVQGARRTVLPELPARNFAWRPSLLSPIWALRMWHRAKLPIPIELWTGRVNLYHATDFVLPPTLPGTHTLLTIHDLSFVRVPETTSASLKAYLDVVVPNSVQRAEHVLADSEATKNDLVELYGTPAEKITVLLSGVDARFHPVLPDQIAVVKAKYKISDAPYLFYVGTVQPRKNYERLMEALAALPPALTDTRLIIAGGKGWLQDPIYQAVQRLKLTDRVQFIGFAADEDLPALYSGARAVPFVSLFEGFGLPVLESMACGVPVITSTVSSMPEAAGNAALLVDPYSVEQIRDALIRVLDDDALRARLIQDGFARAAQFTWQRSAQALRAVYARWIN